MSVDERDLLPYLKYPSVVVGYSLGLNPVESTCLGGRKKIVSDFSNFFVLD